MIREEKLGHAALGFFDLFTLRGDHAVGAVMVQDVCSFGIFSMRTRHMRHDACNARSA